jgi:hypothetical protein
MPGKMWVDEQQYQWVRVQAEVFRPVVFGLFIAHVEPGTRFLLEQEPVEGRIWLRSHFTTPVKARILFAAKKLHGRRNLHRLRPLLARTSAANAAH